MLLQIVVLTEPHQAMQVLRSSKCDKLPFQYKQMDPVRLSHAEHLIVTAPFKPHCCKQI